MAIDPDEFETWGEDGKGRGGGGGGKREHQGKNTQAAIREREIQNSKLKTKEMAEEHPRVAEEINPDINVTLRRVARMDDEREDLFYLKKYISWVKMRINHYGDKETSSVESECSLEFIKKSGPGGQNRNKVETGVSIQHRMTGMRLEEGKKRTQIENRQEAVRRMTGLVEDHIERWTDVFTESDLSLDADIERRLELVLGEKYSPGKCSEAKRLQYERLRELLREKRA